MRIVQQLDDVTYDRNSVVTVGSFDGIHRAHAELFRQAVARATHRKGRSVVVTFEPHPKEIVGAHPEEVRLLTTPDERSEACAEAGIDLLVVLRFDRTFAGLSSREFTKRFLVEGIGVAEVVEGYDHHWGRNREGDLATLRELG
jgi:riboflavin kinase/FMN adenylyltransferase